MSARITTTHSMRGGGSGPSVAEIRQFIAGVPEDSIVVLTVDKGGNQLDPGGWSMSVSGIPLSAPGAGSGLHYPPGVRGRGLGGAGPVIECGGSSTDEAERRKMSRERAEQDERRDDAFS